MAEPEDRPTSIAAYRTWLKDQFDVEITSQDATYHESLTLRFRQDFESGDFWAALMEDLTEFDAEYQVRTSYGLLMNKDESIRVLEKSFDSFLLKTFRKNIVENDAWPEAPEGGWFLPSNWYERINDCVRTTLVVKYLDGVQYLESKLRELADRLDIPCTSQFEAKEEGYYAAHVYIRSTSVVPARDWQTLTLTPLVEIQVTTQLQDVIRRLLHRYYEDRRQVEQPSMKWQWEYRSDEFVANYLGHILHYVEGMIMDIREKQQAESQERTTS
jgi:hypothetical protein